MKYLHIKGETDVVFNFKSPESLDKWTVTCDSDHNEGNSIAKLEITGGNTGFFHGYVDSRELKDGKIKRTGYANIRTKPVRVGINKQ